MKYQLRFAGEGGQGVITAGEILCAAWCEVGGIAFKASTYTSQVRGGPTKVDIVLSDEKISYPYALDGEIDFMLCTAQKGYNEFKGGLKNGGIMVVEPNLVKVSDEDKKNFLVFEIPIISIAKNEVGNVATQSVVALAIAAWMSKCMDIDVLKNVMLNKVPPKTISANEKAYDLGIFYAKKFMP